MHQEPHGAYPGQKTERPLAGTSTRALIPSGSNGKAKRSGAEVARAVIEAQSRGVQGVGLGRGSYSRRSLRHVADSSILEKKGRRANYQRVSLYRLILSGLCITMKYRYGTIYYING